MQSPKSHQYYILVGCGKKQPTVFRKQIVILRFTGFWVLAVFHGFNYTTLKTLDSGDITL